jgi:hypothetical protein
MKLNKIIVSFLVLMVFGIVSCVTTSKVDKVENLPVKNTQKSSVDAPKTRNFESTETKMNKASEIKIVAPAENRVPPN